MAQQERQLILHRSLTTPNLLGGGERELVIVLWTLIAALVFGAGIRPLSLFVGLLVGVGGQFGTQQGSAGRPVLVCQLSAQPHLPGVVSRSLARQGGAAHAATLRDQIRRGVCGSGNITRRSRVWMT
jgi:hypothetical protein